MPRHKSLQTNFTAGELAPDIRMRHDTDQFQNGAKSLLNRRCLFAGGTVRRPGTWWLVDLPGPSRIAIWTVSRDTRYVVVFGDGTAFFYRINTDDGSLTPAGSLTDCPWTGSIYAEMGMVQSGEAMFLTHAGMMPQIVRRTGNATWAVGDFEFYEGPAGRPEQPYLKFAPADMTLTCSDVSGSITLTVSGSDPWFVDDHVGTYIRYHKKACLITAVAVDGLSCTATVIEKLPETYSVTVASSANFAVGEIVEGSETGAKGVITSIPDSTHVVVVLTEGLGTFTGSDDLVGPNDKSRVQSSPSTTTNGAVTDWDEQMFSDVWGYPSCVELHRNRMLFGGHATAGSYLIGSALNNLYNFNVGDASDGDAILESIGDDAASRIVQLHSAEQLIVATDNGPYYVPENATTPFRPSSIAFYPFGSPWPITEFVRHEPFDNGVVMLSRSTVIKARPTGDLSRAWEADEISPLAHHLLDTPTDITVTSNFAEGPERYAIIRNSDGTLAVMQLVEKQQIRNFTPWRTRDGDSFQSIAASEQFIYAAATRRIAGTTVYTLELFDQDLTLDAVKEYNDLADVAGDFGGTEVHALTAEGRYLGTLPLGLSNAPDGPYYVGLYYDSEIELLPPSIQDNEGSLAADLLRIVDCQANVIGSQRFAANGFTLSAYHVGDQVDEPPPAKDGWQRFGSFLGWRKEPTVLFNQPDPLPLQVLAVRTTVAY